MIPNWFNEIFKSRRTWQAVRKILFKQVCFLVAFSLTFFGVPLPEMERFSDISLSEWVPESLIQVVEEKFHITLPEKPFEKSVEVYQTAKKAVEPKEASALGFIQIDENHATTLTGVA
ncbi:hypothetical protein IID04_08155, partial [PVC group bacterium]|nr:hypothetical protein [PVC group bacterium]